MYVFLHMRLIDVKHMSTASSVDGGCSGNLHQPHGRPSDPRYPKRHGQLRGASYIRYHHRSLSFLRAHVHTTSMFKLLNPSF